MAKAATTSHMADPVADVHASVGQRGLPFILVTIFIDSMGFGLIMPVLPNLLMAIGRVDEAGAVAIGHEISQLMAIATFFAAPLLGNLSDRFGRRPVLLLSLAGLMVDYVLLAIAQTLPDMHPLKARAEAAAAAHLGASLAHVAGDYMGEHWLATFATLATVIGLFSPADFHKSISAIAVLEPLHNTYQKKCLSTLPPRITSVYSSHTLTTFLSLASKSCVSRRLT
ncbi:DUF2891 family protein [bacterium]|nr:DUF2891 family protein [bacterium]